MTVGLPDGSLARIEYKGDIAPKVTIEPVLNVVPVELADAAMASPFALFNRISADMSRQVDATLRQARLAEAAAAKGAPLEHRAFGALPPGMVSYRFISTSTGTAPATPMRTP